ncbi:hypothetical protein ACFL2Q_00155, partial [Thermodesulfobacteriota bacterium]
PFGRLNSVNSRQKIFHPAPSPWQTDRPSTAFMDPLSDSEIGFRDNGTMERRCDPASSVSWKIDFWIETIVAYMTKTRFP